MGTLFINIGSELGQFLATFQVEKNSQCFLKTTIAFSEQLKQVAYEDYTFMTAQQITAVRDEI